MRGNIRFVSWSILTLAGLGVIEGARADLISDSTYTPVASAGERNGADIATLDVAGIPSMDGLGSPNNIVVNLWVGPHNEVTGIGWDVVLQTVAPNSWLTTISALISNSSGAYIGALVVTPGSGHFNPGGPTPFSSDPEIIKLVPNGLGPVVALSDGYIRVEFFEDFDDVPGEVDGRWISGDVRFQTSFPIPPIPSPTWMGMLVLACVTRATTCRRSVTC